MKSVALLRGFSVIGGGHTTTVLKEMGISKNKFDYVSLSGGATVEYILGKKFLGIEVLKKQASWDHSKLYVSKAMRRGN